MIWLYLVGAILGEVAATLSLKGSATRYPRTTTAYNAGTVADPLSDSVAATSHRIAPTRYNQIIVLLSGRSTRLSIQYAGQRVRFGA